MAKKEKEKPEQKLAVVSEVEPERVKTDKPNLFLSRKLQIVLVCVLLVAAIIGFYAQGSFNSALINLGLMKPTPGAKARVPIPHKPVVKIPPFVDDYLKTPQLLNPAPNFFSNDSWAGVPLNQIKYYKIGTTHTGEPIILADGGVDGENRWGFSYIALQTGAGSYSILAKPSNLTQYNTDQLLGFTQSLAPNVIFDQTTNLPDLALPRSIVFQNTPLEMSIPQYGEDDTGWPMEGQLSNIRGQLTPSTYPLAMLGNYGPYSFYQVTEQSGTGFAVHEDYLAVGTEYAANYEPTESTKFDEHDNKTRPAINWSGGTTNSSYYSPSPIGCGSFSGYLVATGLNVSSLTAIGTAPDGSTLYELPTTSPLFQKLSTTDYTGPSASSDRLQAEHAIFLMKDGMGELVVYLNQNLFQQGGCAKPQIYLYPPKTEPVSVSVGAHINQSVPLYGPEGWQDVLAQPNGELTYDGKSYSSLYWEGTGDGDYPVLTSGKVVPTSEAIVTIKIQMAEQGYKTNEINDFLAYWAPRLPKTPYTRLTWLTTQQMNELAPLNVSPKPETLIRTFLDFVGLNAPEKLTAQHFAAPVRRGFTVVEWGGLER